MELRRMRAFIHSCLLLGFVFLLTSPIPAQSDTSDPSKTTTAAISAPAGIAPDGSQIRDERYRIGFQDALEVHVFRHPELTQRVNVNTNGTINLYRLPEPIIAVCKTEHELKRDIEDAYRKDYLKNPEVNVVAVEQRSRAFAVIGAVEKPGQYMISRRVQLLELIAQAGGPSKEAGTRVLVARTGSTSNCKLNEAPGTDNEDIQLLDFRLKDILEAKHNLVMRPGDIVSVMKADAVFVFGNVNKQGRVEIREPLTLTQALASAEGLKSASDKDKILVIRQIPGTTERKEFAYDLNEITKRNAPDPFLEPNDIVAVNLDKTKDIFNSIGRSLTNGIPSILYRVP
jgi:polysaccharide biosynthesis/export protein